MSDTVVEILTVALGVWFVINGVALGIYTYRVWKKGADR